MAVSYVLASASYFLINPPWNLVAAVPMLEPLVNGPANAPLLWTVIVSWCIVATFAFWRWRKQAWPVLLSAPFALSLVFEVGLMFASCVIGHACV